MSRGGRLGLVQLLLEHKLRGDSNLMLQGNDGGDGGDGGNDK